MTKTVNGFTNATVSLSGETEVVFKGEYNYIFIKNDTGANVDVYTISGSSTGSDGVMTIANGESGRYEPLNIRGETKCYISGTGSVAVAVSNTSVNPFKMAPKGGEGGDSSAPRIVYAKCETGADEQQKVIILEDGYTIKNGDIIHINFSNSNTYNATQNEPVTFKIGNDVYQPYRNVYEVDNDIKPLGANVWVYGQERIPSKFKVDVTNKVLLFCGRYWDDNSVYYPATQTSNGLMSAADKTKLDNSVSADMLLNPNLLINPDFAINQRGIYGNPIYSAATDADNYTFDRWFLDGTGSYLMYYQTTGAPTFGWTGSFGGTEGRISQIIEDDVGENYSISYDIRDKSTGEINPDYIRCEFDPTTKKFSIVSNGNDKNVLINWVKLERGTKVTPYIAPNPTEELQKCLRYFEYSEFNSNLYVIVSQYYKSLSSAVGSVSYAPKRIDAPTVKVETFGGWRAIMGTSGVINISGANVYQTNRDFAGIEFVLSTATPAPLSGWVDKFKVKIDAEIR